MTKSRTILWILPIAALAAGGYFGWQRWHGPDAATQADNAQKSAAAARRPPVPVTIAPVVKADFPVYLTGLGTVQGFNTVLVRTRVDGQIDKVAFKEGQLVNQGDLLIQIDPRPYQAALDQAKAKKAQDTATLSGLEKDLARFKELGSKGYETQQNLDQQQAKVDTSKASVAADDAAIETAQTQMDYTDIRAPSDGRMGVRLVDPGNIVHASDAGSIAVLVRIQPTFVMFTLPAQTLDDVRSARAKGAVQVVAYDRDNRRALSTGTLETIDNMIDQTTASYRLKATFANEDEKLWPGQFVNARLLVETRDDALVVPNVAIQRGPQGLFAWVVTAKNTAAAKPIEVGPSVGDVTIVTSGISEGERIVIGGQSKLRINAPVNATDAAAPAAKGTS